MQGLMPYSSNEIKSLYDRIYTIETIIYLNLCETAITISLITSCSTCSTFDSITATKLTKREVNQAAPVLVSGTSHDRSCPASGSTAGEGVSIRCSTIITRVHSACPVNAGSELVGCKSGAVNWHSM